MEQTGLAAVADARETPFNILITDDCVPTANALARAVRGAGYRAAVAHTAAAALSFAGENLFHAALVDLNLPDMHGLLLSTKLREILGPDAPIIVVSGDSSMTNLNSLAHVGATHFFSKPVAASTLLVSLNEIMGFVQLRRGSRPIM